MSEPVPWHLLDRYLARDCDERERAIVERWIAADPSHGALVESLAGARPAVDIDQAWRSVEAAIAADAAASSSPPTAPPRRAWTWSLRAAAAVALVTGGALVGRYALRDAPEVVVPAMARARTGPAGQDTILLADGSRVVLGAASELRYPLRLNGGTRTVRLRGIAWFDVASDSMRPFIVETDGAITRVLGTEFNVSAFAGQPVEVVVARGSVSLRAAAGTPDGGVVLAVGQLGRVERGEPARLVGTVAVDRYLGWMAGELAFDDVPLDEVLARVGAWYETRIVAGDSALARHRVTAVFRTRSLDEVAAALALAVGAHAERDAGVIRILPGARTP